MINGDPDDYEADAAEWVVNQVNGSVSGDVVQAGRIDQINYHHHYAAPALEDEDDGYYDLDDYEFSYAQIVGGVVVPSLFAFALGLYIRGIPDIHSMTFPKLLVLVGLALFLLAVPMLVAWWVYDSGGLWDLMVLGSLWIAGVAFGCLLHPVTVVAATVLGWMFLLTGRIGFRFLLVLAALVVLAVFLPGFFWSQWTQAGNVMGWLF